jgi:hypothetical protein
MNTDLRQFNRGAVVRHRRWNSTGTVMRRQESTIFVAWHSSFVEDELTIAAVELVANASPEARAWRGGVGVGVFERADDMMTRPE